MADPPPRRRRDVRGAEAETMHFVTVGDVLSGRYELVAEVGRGGMGVVFEAIDQRLDGHRCAVKVLPPELSRSSAARKRLKKEALAAKALTHPNILRLDDYEEDGDFCYLVMELLRGEDLDEVLADEETLPLDQVLEIGRAAAAALDEAHARNVVHRDVKPANLVWEKADRGGRLKLTDFGIAAQVRDSMTRLTGVDAAGTPLYCPPEQLRGGEPDARADQYALAATLYEALRGRPPFKGPGLIEQVRSVPAPPIDGQPAHVNAALLKALEKNPRDRFDSVLQLVEAMADPSYGGAASTPASDAAADPVAPPPDEADAPPDRAARTRPLEASPVGAYPTEGEAKPREAATQVQADRRPGAAPHAEAPHGRGTPLTRCLVQLVLPVAALLTPLVASLATGASAREFLNLAPPPVLLVAALTPALGRLVMATPSGAAVVGGLLAAAPASDKGLVPPLPTTWASPPVEDTLAWALWLSLMVVASAGAASVAARAGSPRSLELGSWASGARFMATWLAAAALLYVLIHSPPVFATWDLTAPGQPPTAEHLGPWVMLPALQLAMLGALATEVWGPGERSPAPPLGEALATCLACGVLQVAFVAGLASAFS